MSRKFPAATVSLGSRGVLGGRVGRRILVGLGCRRRVHDLCRSRRPGRLRAARAPDTTACIAGGLVGIEGIPAKWSSLMRGRAIADHRVTRLVKGAWSRCPDLSGLAKLGCLSLG